MGSGRRGDLVAAPSPLRSFCPKDSTRMSVMHGPLLFMIINHDQTGVNYTRDPQKQSKHEAKQKTAQPSGKQNRYRWTHDTEEKSQCFHRFLFSCLPDSSFFSS